MNEILKQFKEKGSRASYHFADDSGREWDHGWRLQRECEAMYVQHGDLQSEMREIAKGFLWTLKA